MTAPITLVAPFAGWLGLLDEVPDPVFAEAMMGPGLALDPLDGVLRAPADGHVVSLASTGHSITIELANGAQILMHIGIETVALRGAGFAPAVAVGDTVVAGQPLIAFDLDRVAAGARSLITPIVVASPGFALVDPAPAGPVVAGDRLFAVVGESVAQVVDRGGTAQERVVIVGPGHGIHARPAARIAAALAGLAVELTIRGDIRQANARSPVALLTLDARAGDTLVLRAQGPDASRALDAVSALIAAADPDAHELEQAPASASSSGPVCASPGLAVGPIARLRIAHGDVPHDGEGFAVEAGKLAAARKAAAERLGDGGIAVAHRALIGDPEMGALAERHLAEGRSAGWAWRAATQEQADGLRATGNPRLIERIADLTDVAGQVLGELGHGGTLGAVPDGAIVVAEDLLPSQFVTLQRAGRIGGICLSAGGPTSHVAILAAAAGIPMLVVAGSGVLGAADGAVAVLDAGAAQIDFSPTADLIATVQARLAEQGARRAVQHRAAMADAHTACGAQIEVFANCGSAVDARNAVAAGAEGCGLLRSEFLFLDRTDAPGLDEQRATYQAIADAMQGRPLIVRTLDVGADKPLAYVPMPTEENPALGQRGIRLSLARPELMATQLAALVAVQPVGQVRIMAPMVVDRAELRQLRAQVSAAARDAGIETAIAVGVMVETPAAALLADQLAAEADFLSIGTNDLTQYALAADRGNPATAAMIDALHPAVLRLIAQCGIGAAAHGCPVGICGSAAGDPLAVPLLIGLGVSELSVTANRVAATKALLRTITLAEARDIAQAALAADSAADVRALVRARLGDRLQEG
ncbi:phosphoenolpyruvate--protein phosphotransferase [Novosphingobium sp. FKTRR1]|uniref:phosphoenolpyruvate--protein phosphotransferase n=1 Tax=Novosphingobium sp. FKTRR1 TaxID=2879118 RepID=UPI001CEFFF06|nr:phosphoenolpyruvate--protein phosphotransferase [Novosphingobium sp. FKTRR1]